VRLVAETLSTLSTPECGEDVGDQPHRAARWFQFYVVRLLMSLLA